MVIFLVGLVSMILMRTLRKDYARYSKEEEMDDMVRVHWLSSLLLTTLSSKCKMTFLLFLSYINLICDFFFLFLCDTRLDTCAWTFLLIFFLFVAAPSGQRPGRWIWVEAGTRWRFSALKPSTDILLAHRLRLPDLLRVPHCHHRCYGWGSVHRVSSWQILWWIQFPS